jgi:hypothetical protein
MVMTKPQALRRKIEEYVVIDRCNFRQSPSRVFRKKGDFQQPRSALRRRASL